MRVLSLFPSLDPAGGGIQSGGVSMVLASRDAGIEHVVGCTAHPGARARSQQMIGRLHEAGVPVFTFPPLRHPAELADRWSINLDQVPWIFSEAARFDAIHVHGVWNIAALSGLAAARARRIPLVVTSHESLTANDIDTSRSAARRRQKLALKSLYLRWTDLFVLTSELETRESLPPTAPAATIPYPLPDDDPDSDPAPRGRAAGLTIGYLGRIAPKKNVPVLIKALSSLPDHVRLLIAGDGPQAIVQQARRLAVDLGVAERIEWLGFVAPRSRAEFLARVDVMAMPSSYESFGMSAAEAMLAGVPLVVSHRTGIAELIDRRGGGVLIDPNAESLAGAVRQFDRDRVRLAVLGRQARAAVRHELDPARIGERLLAAYATATERGNGHGR